MLDKVHGKMTEIGEIQSVQPNHRARPVFAMVVIVPSRREDHIALLHLNSLSVNSSEATVAFDNEAHGKSSVTVGGGSFIGHDQLEACVESVGRIRCI